MKSSDKLDNGEDLEINRNENTELIDYLYADNSIFRQIIEQTNEGVLLAEVETGNLVFASNTACSLFGYTQKQFLSLNFRDIHPKDSLEFVSDVFHGVSDRKDKVSRSIPCLHRNGTVFYVDIRSSIVKIKNRDYNIGFFTNAYDSYNEHVQLKSLIDYSEEFMAMSHDNINYKKILDTALDISKADYGVLNLFNSDENYYITKSFAGLSGFMEKINSMLGFELKNKKWIVDPEMNKKVENSILTKFNSISELSSTLLPKSVAWSIQTAFGIGEIWIVKILKGNDLIGDFALVFKKGKTLENAEILKIYTRLTGLALLRAKSESKEKSLRNRFRAVLDAVPNLVFAKDYTGKYLMSNKAFAHTYGMKPGDVVGKNDMQLGFTEEEQNIFVSLDQNVIDSGKPRSMEIHTTNSIDGKVWYQITKLPFDMPDVEGGAVLGVATNITESKLSTDLLKVRDDLLTKLSRQLPGVIYQFKFNADGSSNLPFASEGIYDIFGVRPYEVLENSEYIFDKIHRDDFPHVYKSIIKSRDTLEDWRIDFRINHPEKGLRWLNGFARPEKHDDGCILWHGFIHDITGRKLLEERQQQLLDELTETKLNLEINLNQKNALIQEITDTKNQLELSIKEKDKFFSIIAHDLRSPFNGFLGLTKFLADDLELLAQEDLKELTKTMKHSAESLYSLLENLLEWASIKRNDIKFNPATTNFSLLIQNNINIINANLKNKEIVLTNYVPDEFFVYADTNMLNAVLRNLLTNALKFSRRGGHITISAEKTSKHSMISITDTGIGINNNDIPNLFDITKKVSQPGTEGETSSGLGLILCKEYIEQHGGKIWVKSEVNVGSTFYFTIPNK
ncbi:MAG: PAS domain S-box protein [Candidatus Kapabacteria bacterium]|nr:PAS domain S-box protein [Candidatus Kapabacteria bacterium]